MERMIKTGLAYAVMLTAIIGWAIPAHAERAKGFALVAPEVPPMRLGHNLIVFTSYITDSDGIDRKSFRYQWFVEGEQRSGGDSGPIGSGPMRCRTLDDAPVGTVARGTVTGGTGRDHLPPGPLYAITKSRKSKRYSLKIEDRGERFVVFVKFTDNEGNPECRESLAKQIPNLELPPIPPVTDPVEETLSAQFVNIPSEHGRSAFNFEFWFSETPARLSFRTMRDAFFTVAGGTIKRARRRDGSRGWLITVEPETAAGAVTMSYDPTTDCAAAGAVCTGDGKKLASGGSASVAGLGGTNRMTATPVPALPIAGGLLLAALLAAGGYRRRLTATATLEDAHVAGLGEVAE